MRIDYLEQQYADAILSGSDISDHLPLLLSLAHDVDNVVELGVRNGISTRALCASLPYLYIGVDISYSAGVADYLKNVRNEFNAAGRELKYAYVQADSADVNTLEIVKGLLSKNYVGEPDDIGLLFIDTRHDYDQCIRELNNFAPLVNKYIALHDTVTFGIHGETTPDGLIKAINEFLASNEGQQWERELVDTRQNGLTVLRRKSYPLAQVS